MESLFTLMKNQELTPELLDNFIKQGGNINDLNVDEESPLIITCQVGDYETAKLLLERFADMDNNDLDVYDTSKLLNSDDKKDLRVLAQQTGRKRPLVFAVLNNETELVKLLLEYGADPELLDDCGWSAFVLAEKSDNVPLLMIFMHHRVSLLKRKLEMISKHPDNYDDQEKIYHELCADSFNYQSEDEVKKQIKIMFNEDKDLCKYPELLKLIDSVKLTDRVMNVVQNANADDQSEGSIIQIGHKDPVTLHYFCNYNWSYGANKLILHERIAEGSVDLISWDISGLSDTRPSNFLRLVYIVCQLAQELGCGNVSFKVWLKFLVLVLSRRVQTKQIELKNHGFYINLNGDEYGDQAYSTIWKDETPIDKIDLKDAQAWQELSNLWYNFEPIWKRSNEPGDLWESNHYDGNKQYVLNLLNDGTQREKLFEVVHEIADDSVYPFITDELIYEFVDKLLEWNKQRKI